MKLDKRLERARKKVVLALDVNNLEQAVNLIEKLSPYVGMFKVGLELLTTYGAPRVINILKLHHVKIFYDGKFDDIPATIAGAVKAVVAFNVSIFNIHASASMASILSAVENKGRSKLYAVSVLTSIDENNSNIVFGGPPKAKVLQMAREVALAGCDGLICSPQELEMLRSCPELNGLKIMTPGIRPAFSQLNDQKRTMTPAEAIKAGADYLVIGRPITKPDSMSQQEAALKVLEEIAEVLDTEDKREIEIKKIFEETEAIITGSHIVYTSGKHGDAYVNKDAVYPYTEKISKLCSFIAEDFEEIEIDTVIGPVVGGVALAQWTAHHLSKLQGKEIFAVCADKSEGGGFEIKRGQDKFIKGKKVLVVEDILNTGGSVKKVVETVEEKGGEVVGVGALCNRGNVTHEQIGNVPELKVLMNVSLEAYYEADCPHCKNEIPINISVGKGADYLKKKSVQVD